MQSTLSLNNQRTTCGAIHLFRPVGKGVFRESAKADPAKISIHLHVFFIFFSLPLFRLNIAPPPLRPLPRGPGRGEKKRRDQLPSRPSVHSSLGDRLIGYFQRGPRCFPSLALLSVVSVSSSRDPSCAVLCAVEWSGYVVLRVRLEEETSWSNADDATIRVQDMHMPGVGRASNARGRRTNTAALLTNPTHPLTRFWRFQKALQFFGRGQGTAFAWLVLTSRFIPPIFDAMHGTLCS